MPVTSDNRQQRARNVADNLRQLMDRNDLNQAETAARCNVSEMAISRALQPRDVPPGTEILANIADGFGVTVDQLLGTLVSERKPNARTKQKTRRTNSNR